MSSMAETDEKKWLPVWMKVLGGAEMAPASKMPPNATDQFARKRIIHALENKRQVVIMINGSPYEIKKDGSAVRVKKLTNAKYSLK